MTPPTPEWRRNRGDAVLDGECAVAELGWWKFEIDKTTDTPWKGAKVKWWKANRIYTAKEKREGGVWRMNE